MWKNQILGFSVKEKGLHFFIAFISLIKTSITAIGINRLK